MDTIIALASPAVVGQAFRLLAQPGGDAPSLRRFEASWRSLTSWPLDALQQRLSEGSLAKPAGVPQEDWDVFVNEHVREALYQHTLHAMTERVDARFSLTLDNLDRSARGKAEEAFSTLSASTCHPDAVIAVKDAFVQVRALPPLPRTPAHAPH